MKKRREKTAKKVKKHALLVKKSRFHMTKKRSGMKNSEKGKKDQFSRFHGIVPAYRIESKKTEPVMLPSEFPTLVGVCRWTLDLADCRLA